MSVPTILLHEGDPSTRDLLCSILTDDGHAVTVCGSLDEVMALGTTLPGALAVVDFGGASHRVLADDERRRVVQFTESVPTILVTARTWATDAVARDLGCLAIVRKPFDIDTVSAVVSAWSAVLHVARQRLSSEPAAPVRSAAGCATG